MPRRNSRADRRGTILLGAGMTLPHADVSPDGPERHQRTPGVSKTTTGAPEGYGEPLAGVWGDMAECEFQQHVEYGLRQRGFLVFHVRDARLMAAGLPDVIAVREGQLLFLELKREHGGRISEAQREALAVLGTVPGVVVRLVRPSDWPSVLADLDR